MRRALAVAFLSFLFCQVLSYADTGNHGVIYSNNSPDINHYSSKNSTLNTLAGSGSFPDREVWRSGVAGTVAMWRRLIVNALPSNEGFPAVKPKKSAAGGK